MHCFRRAVSRLQLSNAAPSSITRFGLLSRARCNISCSQVIAATRLAQPLAIQTRWNSTSEPKKGVNVSFIESTKSVFQGPPSPKPTVYVGNLFFDVTAEDLRAEFEKFGVVENTMIVHDNRGLSKGFGYVTFSTVQEATNAISRMHDKIFQGRRTVVNFANTNYVSEKETKKSSTLYMGNIPYELTDVDLQDIFTDVQGITDVRIPVDRATGLPRGFGHIDFVTEDAAAAAKEILARKAPYGRKLNISYAKRRMLTPNDVVLHSQKKLDKRDAARKALEQQDDAAKRSEILEPELKKTS